MKRCIECAIPDTRPDTQFVDGVCSACITYKRRPVIDWPDRKRALLDLLDRHDGRCIVPSSGGKDSTYQALTLRDMGATVIVVTATTCHLTDIGRQNIDNLARYCETIEMTPDPVQRALLNRIGLETVGDISWPEHVAIFTAPFRAAVTLGIPLIFYGENPQNQYGGPHGREDALEMTRRWVSEFGGFLGMRPQDVASRAGDMTYYMPPSAAELQGVEAHFLGQYLPWDSHENARVAIAAGMKQRMPGPANWWPWENLDNAQTGIHDYMMWRKYGYGRGAAQISVDIRSGRVARAFAIDWLSRHDGVYPDVYMGYTIEQILARIGMSRSALDKIVAQFTDLRLFRPTARGPVLIEPE